MLAAVDVLARAGDDAALYHLAHEVREHLGVDAEVVLVHEVARAGVRQRADAELDAVAVVDKLGHILADGVVQLARRGIGDGVDLVLGLVERRDILDVDVHAAADGLEVAVDL